MENVEILGLVAATLTTAAFVPQVYKAWLHKSTRDISMLMYLVIVTGTILWFIYGVYRQSLPIMLANSVTAVLGMLMIYLKAKYK